MDIATASIKTSFAFGVVSTVLTFIMTKGDVESSLGLGLISFAGLTTSCVTMLLLPPPHTRYSAPYESDEEYIDDK